MKIVSGNEATITNNDSDFNIIVNIHPTDGIHCLLIIRRVVDLRSCLGD